MTTEIKIHLIKKTKKKNIRANNKSLIILVKEL